LERKRSIGPGRSLSRSKGRGNSSEVRNEPGEKPNHMHDIKTWFPEER